MKDKDKDTKPAPTSLRYTNTKDLYKYGNEQDKDAFWEAYANARGG